MIKDWVEDLLTLTDDDWARYAFNRDPLGGKITPANQLEFRQKAAVSAAALAQRLLSEYKPDTIEHFANLLGVKLVFKRMESGTGYTLFASYEEPNTITVLSDNAEAVDKLLAEQGLNEKLGNVKTTDLLIAHELYHYFEQTIPDIYSAQRLLSLWKLGPVENRSRIICLGEIGAMAFAKELTGLKCSPNVFDVIMLYPLNQQRAKTLYESYMRFETGQ